MSNSSHQRIAGQLFESGKPRLLPGQGHESDVEVVSEGRGFPGGGVIRADDQGEILRDERGRGVISGILDQFQNLNIKAMVPDQRDLFFHQVQAKGIYKCQSLTFAIYKVTVSMTKLMAMVQDQ